MARGTGAGDKGLAALQKLLRRSLPFREADAARVAQSFCLLEVDLDRVAKGFLNAKVTLIAWTRSYLQL